jgi:hypothetical protein
MLLTQESIVEWNDPEIASHLDSRGREEQHPERPADQRSDHFSSCSEGVGMGPTIPSNLNGLGQV